MLRCFGDTINVSFDERSDSIKAKLQNLVSLKAESGQEDKPSGLAQLSGIWRLVYSSGFASGSIGGRQPGPPAGLLPASLGQVHVNTVLDHMLANY